jgi:DNA-binding protein YbaB
MSHGMDAERYAAVTAAGEAQLAAYGEAAERLAREPVEARSRDGRVRVRAAGAGHVVGLRLSDDVFARYTAGALGEVVTRTVREAQERAAEAFRRRLAETPTPAVDEADQVMAELAADGEE